MNKKYYTTEEIMKMKFGELPNVIYDRLTAELEKYFGSFYSRIKNTFDNAFLYQVDEYCNIWDYIKVI